MAKNKDKAVEVKYQVLQWGPCIVHLKISEEFQQKLLKGAEEARKQKKGMFHVNGWFIISGGNQRSAMRQYKRLYDAGKLKRWPNENDN